MSARHCRLPAQARARVVSESRAVSASKDPPFLLSLKTLNLLLLLKVDLLLKVESDFAWKNKKQVLVNQNTRGATTELLGARGKTTRELSKAQATNTQLMCTLFGIIEIP